MSLEVLALVNYYARSGFYRHVQTVCNEVLKKRGGQDPTLVFWRALGVLREGAVSDAIRELDGIASRGDMQLMLPVRFLRASRLAPVASSTRPPAPRAGEADAAPR
jgi:tetratricopeptide repeat protein 21B